ncbi:MAG: acyl-CoA dehydrogenase family protein, partial [Acidimicrobiales bacterium]
MAVFDVNDDQAAFRGVLRRFVESRIAPLAAGADEREEYSWEAFRACCEMELPSLGVPSEYGGQGADHVTQAISIEELARADASTSVTILISKLGMLPVINFASEDTRHKYLPKIASGELQASYCLSEPDAGSDVASMKARAVRDGDWYV